MKPIISYLRSKNIEVSAYLNDIFICAQFENILKSHVNIVINLLNELGFHINFEKSSIELSHNLVYLGYICNSLDVSISLPSDKIFKVFSVYLATACSILGRRKVAMSKATIEFLLGIRQKNFRHQIFRNKFSDTQIFRKVDIYFKHSHT